MILKAATTHLTKVLAAEFSLRQAPVRVNAIAPGTFPSELSGTADHMVELLKTTPIGLSKVPMGRPGR